MKVQKTCIRLYIYLIVDLDLTRVMHANEVKSFDTTLAHGRHRQLSVQLYHHICIKILYNNIRYKTISNHTLVECFRKY